MTEINLRQLLIALCLVLTFFTLIGMMVSIGEYIQYQGKIVNFIVNYDVGYLIGLVILLINQILIIILLVTFLIGERE